MGLLLSPTQREHLNRGKELFFSPEAIALRSDPHVGGDVQELAALDHFLKGYKNLSSRFGEKNETIIDPTDGKVIRSGKNELQGFDLAVDDEVIIDAAERNAQDLVETMAFIQHGEVPDAFSSLEPDEIEYLREAAIKHISGGAIDRIGERGTTGRTYPKDYADESLRGKPIPAVFEPGQKRERGLKLLTNAMQNIDTHTGAGTYGNTIDALHGEPAAKRPDLLTDINNIRMGNSSLNQSVKAFEGDELKNSLTTRLLRLQDERFALENDIPAKQRGGVDKRTNAENLAYTKLSNSLDALLEDVRNNKPGKRMAGQAMILI